MCFDFRFEAIEGSEGEQKIYTATGTRNRVYPKQGVVSPDCQGIAEYNVHVAANLSSELTRSLYICLLDFIGNNTSVNVELLDGVVAGGGSKLMYLVSLNH